MLLTPPSQTKGGVEISITVAQYTPKTERAVTTAEVVRHGPFEPIQEHNVKHYTETTTPIARVEPPNLEFDMTISNGLTEDLGFRDSTLTLTVGGVTANWNVSGVQQFSDLTLAPGERKNSRIVGPDLAQLKDAGAITFSLDGIITALNSAGQASARENFSWYFSYSVETATATENIIITPYTVDLRCPTCGGSGACIYCTGTGWLGGMKQTNTRCGTCLATGMCQACVGTGTRARQ